MRKLVCEKNLYYLFRCNKNCSECGFYIYEPGERPFHLALVHASNPSYSI